MPPKQLAPSLAPRPKAKVPLPEGLAVGDVVFFKGPSQQWEPKLTCTPRGHAYQPPARGAGQLAPGQALLYVRRTRTSLVRAVRTMYRGTTGGSPRVTRSRTAVLASADAYAHDGASVLYVRAARTECTGQLAPGPHTLHVRVPASGEPHVPRTVWCTTGQGKVVGAAAPGVSIWSSTVATPVTPQFSVSIAFPYNPGPVNIHCQELSREPLPALPGGWRVGDKVWYSGPSYAFASGNRVSYGGRGEVVGPATSASTERLAIDFPGSR